MRRSRRKQRNKKRVLWAGIVLLVIAVFSGCLAWNHLRHPLAILRPALEDEANWETEIAKNFDKDVINFLLLGFDRTAERDKVFQIYRPDTMIVVSVNFRSGEMALLSIPRDSYVNIYERDIYDKINSSYMYGHEYGIKGVTDPHLAGLTSTVKTAEDLLGGIPIHYYFTVDMDGVVEIIDKLGGIYYDVEIPIKDTDGRLLVDKGYQKLDGNGYLQYCRYRGVGGDIGRTQRQQQLLIATFKQLKQAGKLVKIPQVYKSLTETVDTNLNLSQMAALALYGKEIDPEDIKSHVLAGSIQWAPRGEFDICYLVIDEQARVELIKELFGVKVEERPQITLPGPRVWTENNGPEQVPGEGQEEEPPFTGEDESPVPEEPWPEEPWEDPWEDTWEEPEDDQPGGEPEDEQLDWGNPDLSGAGGIIIILDLGEG
ncbi:MAG TPA: LCP family protein [Firmicutes bacterium]|nr:LCP family protein [Bacillota bacterium]